jgi:hypothetical protein
MSMTSLEKMIIDMFSGATIAANSDNSKTITANGQTVIFTPDQLADVCTSP